MNLNKYTKAELISKLKNSNTKEKSSDNNLQSSFYNKFINYISEILRLITLIKEVFFKITFISLIIKVISKYSILRRILKWLKSILFLSFSTSFLNTFGVIDFFMSFWTQIILIYSDIIDMFKYFYEKLIEYFYGVKKEEETPEPFENYFLKDYKNNKSNEANSEEINNNNWISTKNIAICTAIFVFGCLIWVYWDDISTWFGKTPPPDDSNDGSEILFDADNNFNKRLNQIIKDKISGESKDLPSDVLSSDKINQILKDTKNKSTEDIMNAFKEAIEEKNLIKLGKLKVPDTHPADNSLDIIAPSPQSRIGTSSWNDPYERIKSTIINTEGSEKHTNITVSEMTLEKVETSDKTSPIEAYEYRSDSSSETIKPSDLSVIRNWKNFFDSDIKETIDYIENHLPKTDLDETTYLKEKLNEVIEYNISYLRTISENKNQLNLDKLNQAKDVGNKLDKWIEEMSNHISKFD